VLEGIAFLDMLNDHSSAEEEVIKVGKTNNGCPRALMV
jgi:hypothetical protein